MNESQIYLFTKMCEMVGVKIEDVDFKKNGWFLEHEWTKEQEIEFCEWLANELQTNNKIRKELTTLPYRPSKKKTRETAMWFNLMWGWKTKQWW